MTHKLRSISFWSLLASLLFGFYLFLPPRQALADVFVGDCSNNTLLKVSDSGNILATYDLSIHGTCPVDLFFDGTNIWVADFNFNNYGDGVVIKIAPNGATTTYAVSAPVALTLDNEQNVWVETTSNLLRISPTGTITNFGSMSGGTFITGMTFDGTNIWVAAPYTGLAKVTTDGQISFCSQPIGNTQSVDVAFDGSNIWVLNSNYGGNYNSLLLKRSLSCDILNTITFPDTQQYQRRAILFDGTNIWTANYNLNSVTKVAPDYTTTDYSGLTGNPVSIAFDGTNVWLPGGDVINKMSLTGQVSTFSFPGRNILSAVSANPPTFASVTLTSPPNNSTTTDYSLGFWAGTATLTSTSTLDDGFRAGLDIVYCDITRGCLANLIEPNTLYFDTAGTINWFFNKQYILNAGDTYMAYARLRSAPTPTSTILAVSATSTFTIITPFIIPGVEVCEPPAGGFLDYPIDNIAYAVCKASYFLFIPSDTQQNDIYNRLNNIKLAISNKPPFGYFTLINNALGGITEGTTTATTTLSSLASSTIQSFSSIFSPFYNFFVILLWFLLATWLFHRFRLFNF